MGGGEPPGCLVGTTLRPPGLEAEFRAHWLRSDGRAAAVVAGGLTLLGLAFVATDARLAAPPTLWLLLALRALRVALTVVVVWVALRTRRPAVLDACVLAWVASAAVATAAIQSTRPPTHFLAVVTDLLLVVAAWALLPNRFVLQALAAAVATGACITWLVAFRDPPGLPTVLLLGNSLLATNFAAGYASFQLQRSRRLQFLAVREQQSLVEELRASRERLAAVLDASTDGYWERDLVTGRILHSARMNEITGRPAVDTWVGPEEWTARMHPDDLAQLGPLHAAVLSSREERFDRVFRTRHADGSWRWVRSRGKVVSRNEAGQPVRLAGTITDVHAHRQAEEQLLVASRMAALGTLVAGVAHEINNPLTGELAGQGVAIEDLEAVRSVLVSGEAIDRQRLLALADDALEALRDAQAGGQRIARVVRDLSLFGRPEPRRARVRLIDVVDDAMRWLPASISSATTIQVVNRGAPDVLASPGQIGQVLVNIVTNAAKAMAEGQRGVVTVEVGPGAPGMARLEVKDDGVGMGAEVLRRVFDPFFTTRQVGQGTGLGLPICHSIVTAHGGTITATSEPGRGSTFRVEIPAAPDEPRGG